MVLRGLRYSMKGVGRFSGRMRWLGRNLSASGLGVPSVWMKIVRRPPRIAGNPGRRGCVNGRDTDGRVPAASAGSGDRLLWMCLRASCLRLAPERACDGRACDITSNIDVEVLRAIMFAVVGVHRWCRRRAERKSYNLQWSMYESSNRLPSLLTKSKRMLGRHFASWFHSSGAAYWPWSFPRICSGWDTLATLILGLWMPIFRPCPTRRRFANSQLSMPKTSRRTLDTHGVRQTCSHVDGSSGPVATSKR